MDRLRQHFSLQGPSLSRLQLGYNRMGDISFLEHYGQQHQCTCIPSHWQKQGRTVHSSRIRMLLSQGDITQANQLLVHPVIVSGIVRPGAQRGRTLGFPTANLRPDAHKLLPADGVYAAIVHVQDTQGRDLLAPSSVYKDVINIGTSGGGVGNSCEIATSVYKSVVNIGIRPTFNEKERLVEVHLLDTNLDLYDRKLTVEFIEHLRGEQRFLTIDALKAQISADVQKAHHLLTVRSVSN